MIYKKVNLNTDHVVSAFYPHSLAGSFILWWCPFWGDFCLKWEKVKNYLPCYTVYSNKFHKIQTYWLCSLSGTGYRVHTNNITNFVRFLSSFLSKKPQNRTPVNHLFMVPPKHYHQIKVGHRLCCPMGLPVIQILWGGGGQDYVKDSPPPPRAIPHHLLR